MHRLWWVALATIAIASSEAAADPTELGGWFGPRLFSSSSRLGYLDDAPAHPMLDNGIAFGGRVARPFLPWLVPELELALVPTSTSAVGRRRVGQRAVVRAAAPASGSSCGRAAGSSRSCSSAAARR